MPRVSVITPAYDNGATIGAALASVAAQGYDDWEHVVCDDASHDGTAARVEAAERFDRRVRLVRAPRNLGPAGARNLALAAASGELVAFLDADDRLEPRYLEVMVERFDAAGPDCGIVCCDAWREAEDGSRLGRHADVVGSIHGVGLTELLLGNPILIAALCPRTAIDEAGGFSTECFGSEDHDLWLRIVEQGRAVVYVDEPLVIYRLGQGSVSSSRLRMARTDQATFRRALQRGRLDRPQATMARDRLALAVAAEAVARGTQLRDVPVLARAVLARARLWRRRR